MYVHTYACTQMVFVSSLKSPSAAVASGDGDKSDVSPLRSLPTRSRAQALNKRVKGECVCVCACACVCTRVCVLLGVGGGGVLVACCPVSACISVHVPR